MTAEIVPLGGCQIAVSEPRADVIEEARSLLGRAERGELLGFGYFTVAGNNAVGTGWTSGCAVQHLMVTGASMLQHRVVAASLED